MVQLFNLCKWGLIYGAAVRKETRWHCVKAKLHFDKCHQCTLHACPQNHVCVFQRSYISDPNIFTLPLTWTETSHVSLVFMGVWRVKGSHQKENVYPPFLLIPILNCICFVLIPCIAQLFRRFTMWVTLCHIPNTDVICTPLYFTSEWLPALAFEQGGGPTVIESGMASGLWHHNTELRTPLSARVHTLLWINPRNRASDRQWRLVAKAGAESDRAPFEQEKSFLRRRRRRRRRMKVKCDDWAGRA